MRKFRFPAICSLAACVFSLHTQAQGTSRVRMHIDSLCAPLMAGRGYVDSGCAHAAAYIEKVYTELGLRPAGDAESYTQAYTFPVNTFPDTLSLTLDGKELIPGTDFLVNAASRAANLTGRKVRRISMTRSGSNDAWQKKLRQLKNTNRKIYLLEDAEAFCRNNELSLRQLARELPEGVFIIPQSGKLTWTVATDTLAATVFHVNAGSLPEKYTRASAVVRTRFLSASAQTNLIGCVPGTTVPDSFIVFTAHYDHLGKMGSRAVFPGANDNASGTAVMLELARYFTERPIRYSVAFMAFSGEEAGLIGSGHYTRHPLFPLRNIRFLINIDLMAAATGGITVVNGNGHPEAFSGLETLNRELGLLPDVKKRDNAPNSDHYFFTENGVPAFFLYANGGLGHYHDIFDKPETLSLENIDRVMLLLLHFSRQLSGSAD